MGDASKNFSRAEFRCPHCGRLDQLDSQLVAVLQALRDSKGGPLNVVSGYRCCEKNAAVGGYRYSQHLFGRAADIARGQFRATQAKAAGAHGCGVRDGWVIHVDVEPGKPFHTFAE